MPTGVCSSLPLFLPAAIIIRTSQPTNQPTNLNRSPIQMHVNKDGPSLQVLQLGSNQVASITSLHLGNLSSLRSLFLQNNDITRVDGLQGLVNLQV